MKGICIAKLIFVYLKKIKIFNEYLVVNLLMMIGLDDIDLLEFDFSHALAIELIELKCKRRIYI